MAISHSGFTVQQQDNATSTTLEKLAKLPLAFEPNLGQATDGIEYLVHQGRATTYFTPTGMVAAIDGEAVQIELVGANTNANFENIGELESVTHYLIGNDSDRWQRNVPNYQQLHLSEVYPGIDLSYYGNDQRSLEHDFIVEPAADPTQIELQFSGQQALSLTEKGDLEMRLGTSNLVLQAPISYQDGADGSRRTVDSAFKMTSDNTVSIALGEYDRSATLVIDPILVFSTYLGGSGGDFGFGIDFDTLGNVYVGGLTNSSDLPTLSPYQGSIAVGFDGFISKFSGTGNLLYSTYLGGDGFDQLLGIEVDSSGYMHVTGLTSSTDFPTVNAYMSGYNGGFDVFVSKLEPSGASFDFSTYFGGSGNEQPGIGLAVNSAGRVFIAGQTDSTDMPANGYQTGYGGGTNDAFVLQFLSDGTYNWSTYLGGSGNDIAYDIGFENVFGDALVTGHTDSTDYPTVNAYQGSFAGGTNDAFLTRVYDDGSTLDFSTYLGGSGDDQGRSIAVDASGNSHIGGLTDSADFPTLSAYQSTNGGGYDAFAAKFTDFASPIFMTYLGGNGGDFNRGIDIDSNGNVFLAGDTGSTNFPLASPAQTSLAGGSNDTYVTKLNSAGTTALYSTYVGGSSNELATGIAVDSAGNAAITGFTNSSDFPTVSPEQGSIAGGFDAFVAKLADSGNIFVQVASVLTFSVNPDTCDLGHFSSSQTKFCTHTMAAATNASNGYVISYAPTTTLTSGANTITDMAVQTGSTVGNEQFGFNLRANTAAGSFTATDFGADPVGGSGTAMAGYELADQFRFNTGGDDIAESTGPTSNTLFTVSYMTNISLVTESGTYSTPITYTIVPSY